MPAPNRPLIEARGEQMFPTLEPAEIDRLRRFGELRSYRTGEVLVKVGEVGHGLTVILAARVAITRRDELERREAIVTDGPGAFIGEVAQLSGGATLVDAYAEAPVEALVIPPEQLRALFVAEAELGERINFHASRHPIIEGYDPPEGWGWCYIDEVFLDLSDRATPQLGPIPRYV